MTDEIVEISVKELEYLESISENIPGRFRRARVEELKRLIIKGHWQARISVLMLWPGKRGVADAFHRIRAHIELGLPMRTKVLRDCTVEEVAAVDQHLKRSARVQGTVLGKETTYLPLAVALEFGLSTNPKIDNYQKLELREKHLPEIEFVAANFGGIKKFPLAAQVVVAEEFVRLKSNPMAVARLAEFGRVIKNNDPKKLPDDKPALVLVQYLNGTKFADHGKRDECTRKTLTCLRKFMKQ